MAGRYEADEGPCTKKINRVLYAVAIIMRTSLWGRIPAPARFFFGVPQNHARSGRPFLIDSIRSLIDSIRSTAIRRLFFGDLSKGIIPQRRQIVDGPVAQSGFFPDMVQHSHHKRVTLKIPAHRFEIQVFLLLVAIHAKSGF